MTDEKKGEYVKTLWTDPKRPSSFSSADKVYKEIKKEGKYELSKKQVEDILKEIETYSVQRPARKNFKRNKVIVSSMGEQMDGDLTSMENVSKYNSGTKFLLVLIDVFSRFLIIRPLKDK